MKDKCDQLRWELERAKDCLRMRKAWSAKWDVPGSDEQKAHQGAQENVQRNIDNLIDQIKRKCREKCGGFDVPMRFEPPEPEFT